MPGPDQRSGIDPEGMMAVARLLFEKGEEARNQAFTSGQAHLRRAVSTAYYAVFHMLLCAGSQRFMGPRKNDMNSPGAAILYRGFNHAEMRKVCEELKTDKLKERYRRALCRDSVSKEMRDFATAFINLQEQRHKADYNPAFAFEISDTKLLLESAAFAIKTFNRTDHAERSDVLALLLVGIRG